MSIFRAHINQLEFIGHALVRPECVLTTRAGHIYTSDFRGGVTELRPDGEQYFYGGTVDGIGQLKPNGIALLEDGSFLVAHLGDQIGGIYKIGRDQKIEPLLTEIDGQRLPPCNFVYLDHQGRIWITVSTKKIPRSAAYRSDIADGFIIVIDQHGPRVVAEEIGYTNEVYVTPDGLTLYTNATFARELLMFTISESSELTDRKCITSFGKGTFPDGLTQDEQGMLWVTSIVSNRLIRVNPVTGKASTFLEDLDPDHLEFVECAYQQHAMGRAHLDQVKSQALKQISSLAFSGEKRNQMVLGCLLGDQLARLTSPYTGAKPAHWHFDD